MYTFKCPNCGSVYKKRIIWSEYVPADINDKIRRIKKHYETEDLMLPLCMMATITYDVLFTDKYTVQSKPVKTSPPASKSTAPTTLPRTELPSCEPTIIPSTRPQIEWPLPLSPSATQPVAPVEPVSGVIVDPPFTADEQKLHEWMVSGGWPEKEATRKILEQRRQQARACPEPE